MSHYVTIKDQLKADIRAAIGASADVQFGRPRRKQTTYPHANVQTRRMREAGIRDGQEKFQVVIVVRLAIPATYSEDGGEVHAMASADTLIDLLAPYDLAAVPAVAGAYAGVGFLRKVIEVAYEPSEDEDTWVGYRLLFECTTTFYQ